MKKRTGSVRQTIGPPCPLPGPWRKWKHGRTITNADSHAAALAIVLSYDCLWDDEAFTFIAPELLTVYQAGPKYDYMLSEQRDFTVRQGVPMERTA